jgi:hypothetical protein
MKHCGRNVLNALRGGERPFTHLAFRKAHSDLPPDRSLDDNADVTVRQNLAGSVETGKDRGQTADFYY